MLYEVRVYKAKKSGGGLYRKPSKRYSPSELSDRHWNPDKMVTQEESEGVEVDRPREVDRPARGVLGNRYVKKCVHCGELFKTGRSNARFCVDVTKAHSQQCIQLHRRDKTRLGPIKKKCSLCGKEFMAGRKAHLFCHEPCTSELARQKRVRDAALRTFSCLNCGKSVETVSHKMKYCTRLCARRGRGE